jgi:hypothetical protein
MNEISKILPNPNPIPPGEKKFPNFPLLSPSKPKQKITPPNQWLDRVRILTVLHGAVQ